jgi:hypothetical protein
MNANLYKYLFLITFWVTTAMANTQVLWDESVNGPLSGSYERPSVLPNIALGTNIIRGSVEIIPSQYGATTFPDEFLLSIPAGLRVEHVILSSDITSLWVWIGDSGFEHQLGFVGDPTNGDILAQMGLAKIESGNYGMYIQNVGAAPSTAHYQLSFEATVAPEINIHQTAGSMVLRWTAAATNYVLEATTSLSYTPRWSGGFTNVLLNVFTATWSVVTNPVAIVDGECVVTDAITETGKLYRLRK